MVRSAFNRPRQPNPLYDLIYLHPLSQRSGRRVHPVKKPIATSQFTVLPDNTPPATEDITASSDLDTSSDSSNPESPLSLSEATASIAIGEPTVDDTTTDPFGGDDQGNNDAGSDEPNISDPQEQLNQQIETLAQKLHLVPANRPSHPLVQRLRQSAHQVSQRITVPYWRDIPLPKWPVICLGLAGFASGVGLAGLVGILSLSPSVSNCEIGRDGCPEVSNSQSNNFEPLTNEERDNFWLEQAKQLKAPKIPDWPLYQYLPSLWVTRAQLLQPATVSPAKTEAQVKYLEQQIQDLTQLQLAQLLAGMYQVPSLQAAVYLAQSVTPDRPYHTYAQTLIQQWQQTSQRAEDRPSLETAQRLALSGKVEDLKAAIGLAQQIPLGRSTRGEAQALIFRWTRQIQTIEGRPILEQARALAQQNKLVEAIQVASQIPSGHVYSETAQNLVYQWNAQLYSAKDRALLDRATALADQLYLTRAIDLAAQIPPERSLYKEAQAAIADWKVRRTEFWKNRAIKTAQ